MNSSTHATLLVRELRAKHDLDEKRPKPTRAADGTLTPPPLEEQLAYLEFHKVYRAELRAELKKRFRDRVKQLVLSQEEDDGDTG